MAIVNINECIQIIVEITDCDAKKIEDGKKILVISNENLDGKRVQVVIYNADKYNSDE